MRHRARPRRMRYGASETRGREQDGSMCAVGMAEQGRGKNRGFFYHAISPSRHSRSLMLYSTFVHTAPPSTPFTPFTPFTPTILTIPTIPTTMRHSDHPRPLPFTGRRETRLAKRTRDHDLGCAPGGHPQIRGRLEHLIEAQPRHRGRRRGHRGSGDAQQRRDRLSRTEHDRMRDRGNAPVRIQILDQIGTRGERRKRERPRARGLDGSDRAPCSQRPHLDAGVGQRNARQRRKTPDQHRRGRHGGARQHQRPTLRQTHGGGALGRHRHGPQQKETDRQTERSHRPIFSESSSTRMTSIDGHMTTYHGQRVITRAGRTG